MVRSILETIASSDHGDSAHCDPDLRGFVPEHGPMNPIQKNSILPESLQMFGQFRPISTSRFSSPSSVASGEPDHFPFVPVQARQIQLPPPLIRSKTPIFKQIQLCTGSSQMARMLSQYRALS